MSENLGTVDGRPVLRIERWLAHPRERVWRAITEPGELSQWYPFPVSELDLREGGRIRFDIGQETPFDGVITELDPPRAFAFLTAAGDVSPGGREADNVIRMELRPDGDGCLLVFTHTFADRPAAASYAAGWQACLGGLDMLLNGQPVKVPDLSVELYDTYMEKFGLNHGTVEDTPDGRRVRFERQLMYQPVDKVWAALTTLTDVETATVADPPRLLEYDDGPAGKVRWELSEGQGGARVVLTQTGPADLDAARERVNQLMDRLR